MSEVVNILEHATRVRGNIISATIILESAMNIFLSQHFCQGADRKVEIIEMIFATNKFSYENKRDTLCAILKKHASYKISKQKSEKLYEDLKTIATKRNIFAHSELDLSIQAQALFKKNKTIRFYKYVNSKKTYPYGLDDIMTLATHISDTAKFIASLYKV